MWVWRGNEKADVVANSAVRREGVGIQVPLGCREVKSLIWAKWLDLWQRECDASSKGRQLQHAPVRKGRCGEYGM